MRTRPSFSLAILLSLASCRPEGKTSTPPPVPPPSAHAQSLERLLASQGVRGFALSPEGEEIVFAREGPKGTLWRLPLTGAAAKALPGGGGLPSVPTAVLSREGRILVTAEPSAAGGPNLWVREPGGRVLPLLGEELSADRFLGWASDRRSFYVSAGERQPGTGDLYELTLPSLARELALENQLGFELQAVSPDRRHVALAVSADDGNKRLLLFDRSSGRTRELSASEERPEPPRALAFSADGGVLFLLDRIRLESLTLASGERQALPRPRGSVLSAVASAGGRYLILELWDQGRLRSEVLDLSAGAPLALPVPQGTWAVQAVTTPSDEALIYLLASARTPRDLYLFRPQPYEERPLTYGLHPLIASEDLVEPEGRSWTGGEHRQFGWLYRDLDRSAADSPRPALIWVEAESRGAAAGEFDPLVQSLAASGLVVLAFSPRVPAQEGGQAAAVTPAAVIEACSRARALLLTEPGIDPSRIGIVGRRFMGLAALAAILTRPGEYAAGVDFEGPLDWVRLALDPAPAIARWRWHQGLPEADPALPAEALLRWSPAQHPAAMRAPVLLIGRESDLVAPAAELEAFATAVKSVGGEAEVAVIPSAGGGEDPRLAAMQALVAFLDRTLGKVGILR